MSVLCLRLSFIARWLFYSVMISFFSWLVCANQIRFNVSNVSHIVLGATFYKALCMCRSFFACIQTIFAITRKRQRKTEETLYANNVWLVDGVRSKGHNNNKKNRIFIPPSFACYIFIFSFWKTERQNQIYIFRLAYTQTYTTPKVGLLNFSYEWRATDKWQQNIISQIKS